MSDQVNTELLERASEMITLFEGTLPAGVIQADLDRNDLEALVVHVAAAEAQASQEEFEAADVY